MSASPAHLFQRLILIVLLPVLLFASFNPLTAQSTNSTLSGTVKDPSGAVVPKAHLTLTATATGTIREFDTGSDGNYRFSNLQAGPYTLKASSSWIYCVYPPGARARAE